MAWTKVDPSVWKPQEHEQITGQLVNIEPGNGELSNKYFLNTDNGIIMVWGSTVLDEKMKHVSVSNMIRITYEGKTKNKKGQAVNLYTVEVDK
jgi:hypothetical protein